MIPLLRQAVPPASQVHEVIVIDGGNWQQLPGPPWLPKPLRGEGTSLWGIVGMLNGNFTQPIASGIRQQTCLVEVSLQPAPPTEVPILTLLHQLSLVAYFLIHLLLDQL